MQRNFFLETDAANAPGFLAKFPVIPSDKNFSIEKIHQTLFLFFSTDLYDSFEAVVSLWKYMTLQNWSLRGEKSLFVNCHL